MEIGRKLFLDTANLEHIDDALKTGVISGVTTNPSILAKEPKTDFTVHINKIGDILSNYGSPPLSVEVFASHPEDMYNQAHELLTEIQYSNINIKIPVGYRELEVIKTLAKDGVEVNCTCCFTAIQLQLAAKAGARYVSLFYNRFLDMGGDPDGALSRTNTFIAANNLNCEIIAGSIRKSEDITRAWAYGADIVTAGYDTIKQSLSHPGTDMSVKRFLKDFNEWIN